MAPEQPGGDSKGSAGHEYALGVILYEISPAGRRCGPTLRWKPLLLVRTQEPVPARLRPAVPRDLETICFKAMAKEPGRRYARRCAGR